MLKAMMEKLTVSLALLVGLLSLIFLGPLVGPLVGSLAGWLIGFTPMEEWILHGFSSAGVKGVRLFEIGAALGFVGGFFRSTISKD